MAESNLELDWKSSLNQDNIEIFRNQRLEYLEVNLPNFEITTLISLENQCYEESTTKENYTEAIQNLIEGLKEQKPNLNDTNPIESSISDPLIPPTSQIVSPQQETTSINIPDQNDSAKPAKDQNESKTKTDLEAARLRQQIEQDKKLAEYLEKNDKSPDASAASSSAIRRPSIETFWSNSNNSKKFSAYKPDKCSRNFG